ncbi:MAG: lytic transglycosylase [Deltaproteobacteria bacterium HGW-Deltaproteobacteria-5]|jgi:membrane-bound lytic murein transglycosylase D|nr:MAG: lytic transglycosylase [Deltaproteobacteria bacterium HGW-Deltaproteobacteria-5]
MLKCKKYVSSIILIVSLSLIILLVSGFQAFAENTVKQVALSGTNVGEKKQDQKKSIGAVEAFKNMLFGDSKSDAADDENGEGEEDDEQELMENALEFLEKADRYWKKGDIENTLNELDKAYALILDADGEVAIARQKDDLRLLISQRIMAVYGSRQRRTVGKSSEIPHLMNADVEKEIRSFQGPEREFFIGSYERSAKYKDLIVGELRKAGVPEELFWLPLVESGFKATALSSARALGLWQFIPSTGYKFGLSRDEWVDERMDVLKSTQAAIAYLKELHAMFGDWLTVLAAYNCGEGRVLRVISRQQINFFDRFWDLYAQLPNETARYVPRFLATLHIVKNPGKYGFDLQTTKDSLLKYETVKVNKIMKLSDIASKMEVSEETITVLNAELRHKLTPDHEYTIRIPKGSLDKFNSVYNDIPETEKPTFTYARSQSPRSASIHSNSKSKSSGTYDTHRVRRGETLASIANKYGVSVRALQRANRLSKKNGLKSGHTVRIPNGRNLAALDNNDTVSIYKVKKTESLHDIAKRFDVPVAKLKKANNLKGNSIYAGRKIKIPGQKLTCDPPKGKTKKGRVAKNSKKRTIAAKR